LTFVITGVLDSLEREQAEDMIKSLSGKVTGSVSGRTDYLLMGGDAGTSKKAAAEAKGVSVIDEDGLFALIVARGGSYPDGSSGSSSSSSSSVDVPVATTAASADAAPATPGATVAAAPAPALAGGGGSSLYKKRPAAPAAGTPAAAAAAAAAAGAPANKKADALGDSIAAARAATPDTTALWVDVYRPRAVADMVGNQTNATELISFLTNWAGYHRRKPTPAAAATTAADDSDGDDDDDDGDGKPKKKLTPAAAAKKAAAAAKKAAKEAAKDLPKKALLISGPPGIGKSTAAALCAAAAGYEPVEFNASDVRSQSSIKEEIGTMIANRGLSEFFGPMHSRGAGTAAGAALNAIGANSARAGPPVARAPRPVVIIMDEVDGVGAGDRGGIAQLIRCIDESKVPMICICNDASSQKIRSLKNHCEQMTWRRPTSQQLLPRLLAIARQEGLKIDGPAVDKLVTSVHADIRQAITSLQLWATTRAGADAEAVTYDDAKRLSEAGSKDFEANPFELAPSFYRRPDSGPSAEAAGGWVNERINRYFVGADLLPLLIQDNYLNARPVVDPATAARAAADLKRAGAGPAGSTAAAAAELASLCLYSEAADAIAEGDIISEALMSDQNYSLMPAHGFTSTVAPGVYCGGGLSNARMTFPTYFAKLSTGGKNARLLAQIKALVSATTAPATAKALACHYLPALRTVAHARLRAAERAGDKKRLAVDSAALGAMLEDELGLIKDDWEAVVAMGAPFTSADASKRIGKVAFRGKRQADQAARSKVLRFGNDKSKVASARRGAKTEEEEEEEAAHEEEVDDEGGDDDAAAADGTGSPVAVA
jgi:replication factor C subunit 1